MSNIKPVGGLTDSTGGKDYLLVQSDYALTQKLAEKGWDKTVREDNKSQDWCCYHGDVRQSGTVQTEIAR